MPDLGTYAATVLMAWGGTLLALAGLIAQSLWRARAVRRALEAQEAQGAAAPAPAERGTQHG